MQPKLIVGVGDEVFKELKKLNLPVPVIKLLHYSQRIEQPDFVDILQLKNA